MRNRRNVILAFLVVAVLCLGVGFAALQDTLTVGGTLSYDPEKGNEALDVAVSFTGTPAISGTATNKASVSAAIGNQAEVDPERGLNDALTITVGDDAFAVPGQTAIITVQVQNASATAVSVSAVLDGSYATNFSISIPTIEVAAGGTEDIVITITLTSLPNAAIDATPFEITLTAAPTT